MGERAAPESKLARAQVHWTCRSTQAHFAANDHDGGENERRRQGWALWPGPVAASRPRHRGRHQADPRRALTAPG
eukprot:scaffold101144_cov63-Phaeocystis_antarctica.AAC.6